MRNSKTSRPALSRDHLALAAYAAAVVTATMIHRPAILAAALAAVLAAAGNKRREILRRAAFSVVFFNSVVSAAYLAASMLGGNFSWEYLALVNVRVLLLACLAFLFMARANIFKALSFAPALAYLFALAYSQSMALLGLLEDFAAAAKSRSIGRASLGRRYRLAAAAGAAVLDKAMHNSEELSLAMRSRGFFEGNDSDV